MAIPDGLRSIGGEIERLAQETDAPAAFVERVREFFSAKSISLHEDAEPYAAALEQAFLLEENVRRNTLRAKENLLRLQDCLRLVGATYQHQLGQLRRVRDSLDQQNRLAREGAQRLRDLTRAGSSGQTRAVVSAPKGTFLVPGPKDVQ